MHISNATSLIQGLCSSHRGRRRLTRSSSWWNRIAGVQQAESSALSPYPGLGIRRTFSSLRSRLGSHESKGKLVGKRQNWLNPRVVSEKELKQRTLTNVCNENPPGSDRLDRAVFAYDCSKNPDELEDEEPLGGLLALNLERAGGPHVALTPSRGLAFLECWPRLSPLPRAGEGCRVREAR
jgi:hypothetical protein